ncbi:MAG: Na+/H+ antiporter subunit G [Gemmobacter sp.]
MNPIWEYVIAGLLVMAGVFGLVGSVGLVKLPDTMTRLHAPTKATTLGVGGVLLASMAWFWAVAGTVSWHELMITIFLFLTAPITAKFIAKAQIHRGNLRDQLPPTGVERGWASHEPDSKPGDRIDERDPNT